MSALALVITKAGMDRFTAAQLSTDIDLTVSTVGLTAQDFIAAPTLTALPGEFRRIDTISGDTVGDSIVHMVVRDDADVGYVVRGFGLFLADGTLFAIYSQANAIVEKSPVTALNLALDIAFPTADVEALTFDDTNFLNPPGTTERKGVVELATKTEGSAGVDPLRVPPVAVVQAMLEQRLPAGAILLWFGAPNTVPDGWALCDGRLVDRADGNGQIATPDMRGRVAVGATADAPAGNVFGATSKNLNTGSAGGHTPRVTITVDNASTAAGITTTPATSTRADLRTTS